MNHVWILSHYAQEPGGMGGTRHYGLAKNLPAHGWSSTVIAASTELNTARQRLVPGEKRRLVDYSGVSFLWVRAPEYHGNGLGRVTNMLTYTVRVLLPSMTRDLPLPQLVVGSSVHPFAACAGAMLARRYGVPFVFEVRDLWPQTLIDLGRLGPRTILATALRAVEKWLYRRASRIVVLMPRAGDYIVPLGIPAEKIVWIPNGVELEGYPEPLPPPVRDTFTLMYFGAHGLANGLDNILEAMAKVRELRPDLPIRLRLIGDGPLKPALMEKAEQLGLENVTFESPVPKAAIPAVAMEADVFVVNLVDSPIYRFGISLNKLFDYLAAGRPIVFAGKSVNDPVIEADAGVSIPPADPSAFAEAIVKMASLPIQERARMGRNGRAYVKANYDFFVLAKRFGACLDEAVSEHAKV